MDTTAEKIYAAYKVAAADGASLMPWAELTTRPEHRAWFAVANAIEEVAAPPTDVDDPYEYELQAPIEPRVVKTVPLGDKSGPVTETVIREKIPTALKIRPSVAGDLCHRTFNDGTAAFNASIYSHIHGIEVSMYLDRLSPGDAHAARRLVSEAKGTEGWMVMLRVFMDAGGVLLTEDGGTLDHDADGWTAAAFELLADFHDDRGGRYTLRVRDGSTLEIGPLRVRHLNTYESVGETKTEWDARFATLAEMTKAPESKFRAMRIEDATRAWMCFDMLKKKADLEAAGRALSVLGARQSSRSTGGDQQTSKTSPSTG